ncbi:MAG: Holliday junction resolvase RecU [Bacilli bacterium]|nr:Holliday junction resolvase RecU [Bacilli bacterium]
MKYPGGFTKKGNSQVNYANRGMNFEADINITNDYYRDMDIAVIYKKPTPITINKVDYKSRVDAVIKEAHFNTPSTTDYNGIYKGKYIDFEAKETKLNYFPLSNIHQHQIEHLKKIIKHGGIGFILVNFKNLDKIYLLEGTKLFSFIESNERKSIPLEYFEKFGYLIKPKFNPRIDYLNIIDSIYFGGMV